MKCLELLETIIEKHRGNQEIFEAAKVLEAKLKKYDTQNHDKHLEHIANINIQAESGDLQP